MSIAVLLADDHCVLLDGLRFLLETKGDIKVIGVAVNGREAVRKAWELKPDLVIMDIAMPELNGIEAARQICKLSPAARIIILSMHATTEHAMQAIKAGARGYVLKGSTGGELLDAVRTVMAGRRYISQKISDMLLDYVEHPDDRTAEDPLARLSTREREILPFVVEGRSSAEIAKTIFLSPKTVETYRSRLMKKLAVKNLPELVKYAIQKGLTPLE